MSKSANEKIVPVALPLSLWSWCREEAGKLGFRGVKPYLLDLARRSKDAGSVADALEDNAAEGTNLTGREMTDKKQSLIDNWVLSQLEDEESLNALPKQTKASIILARLPKMGVNKGEMEEKALSLRAALKDLPDYEDIQGEMVTLREEVRRLRNECDALEGELRLVKAECEKEDSTVPEYVGGFLDLAMAWRSAVKDALVGRAAAERCRMLKTSTLEEVWVKAARDIAGEVLDAQLVRERLVENED